MILVSYLVDMVDSFDDVAPNKLLVLLSHHRKGCLDLADHPLEFSIDLAYLHAHPLALPLQFVAFLVQLIVWLSPL